MKVLQICLKPPLPATDGGCKAMDSITQGLLADGIDVKVLAIATHKHPFIKECYSPEYLEKTHFECVHIDTEIKVKDAFLNLFTKKSYNINRFVSKDFEELIVATLSQNDFDIVLLESLYVSMYVDAIRAHSKAKIIYRSHNIEYEIWERNAAQSQGVKASYMNLLAKRLKMYEKEIVNHFDGVAAITQKDKLTFKKMGAKCPVEVIPFGINSSNYISSDNPPSFNFFHIGSMDWMPNQEGINWFLKEVWTKVADKNAKAVVKLAGKNMTPELKKLKQNGVEVVGEVKDAIEFINQNDIMIVPLFAGSGMRIKIIEAMALGKMVIATSIAAEGIICKSNENILIANTKEEFIKAIENCFQHPQIIKEIGERAKNMVASNYDNRVIVNNLVEFFKQFTG